MNIYLIGLLAYSALLMTVGIVISRRIKTASDFLVAGRRLGPGLIFTTFLAANLGAGSTVGATGLGYRLGLSAWWWVGSASIGTFILATMLGPRLWEIAQRYSLHTMGDFLEWRYGRSVKAAIAVLLWLGTLAILAGQMIAISWILNVVIGLPKWAGCAIGGAVAIGYCSAGGLGASHPDRLVFFLGVAAEHHRHRSEADTRLRRDSCSVIYCFARTGAETLWRARPKDRLPRCGPELPGPGRLCDCACRAGAVRTGGLSASEQPGVGPAHGDDEAA